MARQVVLVGHLGRPAKKAPQRTREQEVEAIRAILAKEASHVLDTYKLAWRLYYQGIRLARG